MKLTKAEKEIVYRAAELIAREDVICSCVALACSDPRRDNPLVKTYAKFFNRKAWGEWSFRGVDNRRSCRILMLCLFAEAYGDL